jgi:GPH family glycoside/pentoside/hexuronide:cation symporter
MTLYTIPSGAMLPEITSGYDERTSLVSYRFLFIWMGGLLTAQMGYLYFFAPSAQFADGRLNPDAYGAFALACAVMVAVAILVSSAGTHHLVATMHMPAQPTHFSVRQLLHELRDALSNYSYRMLICSSLFTATAAGFQQVMDLYMGTYFWGLTTSQLALLTYAYVIATLLASGLARPLSQWFDKQKTVLRLAFFAIMLGPLPIFLRLADLMPANGTSALLVWLSLYVLLIVTVVIVAQITFVSMLADIVDEHELRTGKRQEGIFVSALSFTAQATTGLGGLFAGVALDLVDFPTGAQVGTVAADTIVRLGLIVGPGLMVSLPAIVSRAGITSRYSRS